MLHVDRRARKGYSARALTIALTIEHGPHRGIARQEISRRIQRMIGDLQLKKLEVSFVLTNDKRVHELNRIYRGKDRPTDVLAFAMQEGEFAALAEGVLGDVIVSVETARKQALSRSIAVLEEVTMLLAHGLLHLLGHDHDTDAKDRRMRAETERLCEVARGQAPRRKARPKASRPAGAADKGKRRQRSLAQSAKGRTTRPR